MQTQTLWYIWRCCNIEFECADTNAEGPGAKFQTSTVDPLSPGPRKPTIVNPAVPMEESPCEREAGHVVVFEFRLFVSVFHVRRERGGPSRGQEVDVHSAELVHQ